MYQRVFFASVMTMRTPHQRYVRPSLVSARVLLTLLWVVLPVLGGGAGYGLVHLSGWLLALPWVPFEGPLRLVESLPEPGVSIGLAVLGGVAGLWLAATIAAEQLSVRVDGTEVTLRRGEHADTFERAVVHTAFTDGADLVLTGAGGAELARERHDLNADAVRAAFEEHGYPWRTEDPYAERFRPWVPGAPDLPADAESLLQHREAALKEEDNADKLRDYRNELARLGVVVRDAGGRQHWRRIDQQQD